MNKVLRSSESAISLARYATLTCIVWNLAPAPTRQYACGLHGIASGDNPLRRDNVALADGFGVGIGRLSPPHVHGEDARGDHRRPIVLYSRNLCVRGAAACVSNKRRVRVRSSRRMRAKKMRSSLEWPHSVCVYDKTALRECQINEMAHRVGVYVNLPSVTNSRACKMCWEFDSYATL